MKNNKKKSKKFNNVCRRCRRIISTERYYSLFSRYNGKPNIAIELRLLRSCSERNKRLEFQIFYYVFKAKRENLSRTGAFRGERIRREKKTNRISFIFSSNQTLKSVFAYRTTRSSIQNKIYFIGYPLVGRILRFRTSSLGMT